jgi:leucyl/phenylalanyl-tRNA--protein transferase
MPIFLLDENIAFPPPSMANRDGLLAVGGDLSVERLLLAYKNGIFPWYDESSPILWWSPDPRMVLFPEDLKVSKSLGQVLRKKIFEIKFDTAFKQVISYCSKVSRPGQPGTWITREMIEAYTALHKEGYAHSVEAYKDGSLAGGLYGVSVGRAFFGESMFFLERDASKVALAALVDRLKEWEFHFVDAQQKTSHLQKLGAKAIRRDEFLKMLERALLFDSFKGNW